MHGVTKGDAEPKPLHVFGALHTLVLVVEGDGLAVDVLYCRHEIGDLLGSSPEGDGKGHGAQHVSCIYVFIDGPVADHGPAGGPPYFGVEAVFFIETHGLRHNDRRGAGNGDEAYRKIFLLDCPHLFLGHGLCRGQRKH